MRSRVITDFAPPRYRQNGNVGYHPVPISTKRESDNRHAHRRQVTHHQAPVVNFPGQLGVEQPQPPGAPLELVMDALTERDVARALSESGP